MFLLPVLAMASLQVAAQCTPAGGVPVVACGTGTALTSNVTISSGTFSATGGTYSAVTVSGGTLVLCGTVTLSDFTINSGNVLINPGASVTVNANYNGNGGDLFNSGSLTFNTSIGIQGTNSFAYGATGSTLTVNGTMTIFNADNFYCNGTANCNGIIINSGAAICAGVGATLNCTTMQNNQTNSLSVPSGTACIHYTSSFATNNTLTSSTGLFICQDPAASAPTGPLGTAQLVTNCSSCQNVLPVKLESFTGSRTGTRAELQWSTAQEEDLASFAVQLSTDGKNFQTIGTIPANNHPSNYSYSATISANSSFRLQMIDIDGKFTYSQIVFIELPAKGFSLAISENPVHGTAMGLLVNAVSAQSGEITIFDNTGRRLKRLAVFLTGGRNDLQIDIGNLSAGHYFLRLTPASGPSNTVPFIKL